MYRVLYRKWRPKTFSDVSGQPHITETLINEVKESRLAHAYLFTGSRGTGKTSCAKILSKAINCLNPQNGNPCNECEICKGIDNGSVLDVVEIDAASNRGIDDIRALREESAFTPAQTKFRVYIIDEVHMLTIEAFNALLKTLEEPPEHIVFILATTEVQKLPSTILSRCQRFDFRRISVDALVARLKFVAKNENIVLYDDAAVLIARIADGAMRDALSILDRCIGISENVTSAVVSDAAGIMSNEHLYRLSETFINNDTPTALNIIDSLHSSSCDTERLCTELTNHFRSLLIIKSVDKPEEILVCTNEELQELKKLAKAFSVDRILYIMNILSAAIASIKVTQNRRIETEMAIIKICSPDSSDDNSALIARIEALEKKLADFTSAPRSDAEKKTCILPPVTEKSSASVNSVLSELHFDDDSSDYDDEIPPPSEESFGFDLNENQDYASFGNSSAPIFDEEPVFNNTPVFDNEPVFDSEPVFDNEPSEPPVFDAPSENTNNVNTMSISRNDWIKCISEAERICLPIIGHLIGTSASLNGKILTITNYNTVLPMIFPMVQEKLTLAVKTVTGLDLSIRLG